MGSEILAIKELSAATVGDLYQKLNKTVSPVLEGWQPRATLLEISESGEVVIRGLMAEFPDGPRRVNGEVLAQAVAEITEDLGVDSTREGRLVERKWGQSDYLYVRAEEREFETIQPDIVFQRTDYYDRKTGSSRGMKLRIVNKQPRSLPRRLIREFFGR